MNKPSQPQITLSSDTTVVIKVNKGADTAVTVAADKSVALTGPINDASGNEVIKLGSTADAVNELTITNAATLGAPGIAATGGDTNIGLTIGAKGTGILYLGPTTSTGVKLVGDQPILDSSDNEYIKFSKTSAAVNEITVKNNATGSGPTITATGGDTNVPVTLAGKGTGAVVLGQATSAGVTLAADQAILDSSSLALIKFTKTGTAVNEITVKNNSTGAWPEISASGETNVSLQLSGKGTGRVLVGDSGTASCTGTGATSTATSSKQVSLLTTAALTTAAGATHTITVTNTKIASGSVVDVTVYRGTATTGYPVVTKVTPGAGSVDIEITNEHPSVAVNGTLILPVNVIA